MQSIINFFFFKVMKVTGWLWILAVIFTSLATGQAEIAYKYGGYADAISLVILVIARIEGHWSDIRQWYQLKKIRGKY